MSPDKTPDQGKGVKKGQKSSDVMYGWPLIGKAVSSKC